MTQPQWKGSITNVRTKRKYKFMFNPLPVTITHGWDYDVKAIPGRSHPHTAGGTGQGTKVDFSLFLDASRGLLEVSAYPNGGIIPPNRALNLQAWIDELLAYCLGADPSLAGSYGVPDTMFLNLSAVYTGEGRLMSLTTEITEMSQNNIPVKARCDLSFVGIRRSNQTADKMLEGSGNDELLPVL